MTDFKIGDKFTQEGGDVEIIEVLENTVAVATVANNKNNAWGNLSWYTKEFVQDFIDKGMLKPKPVDK